MDQVAGSNREVKRIGPPKVETALASDGLSRTSAKIEKVTELAD